MQPIRIKTPNHLSALLGITPGALFKYSNAASYYYRTFEVPKKGTWKSRKIAAPAAEIKGIQKWILRFCLEPIPLHPRCIGFRKGGSIVSHAQLHVNKDVVVTIDIENYFPSITSERVYGIFARLGYSSTVAAILSKLTTYHNALPQGGCTSPYLANLASRKLDHRMERLGRSAGFAFSRYADDIVFSGTGRVNGLLLNIRDIIESEGFVVNEKKVRIQRRSQSQTVTGLTVNTAVRPPRQYRRRIRAVFHQARINPELFLSREAELRGYISYFSMIDPHDSALPKYRNIVDQLCAAQ